MGDRFDQLVDGDTFVHQSGEHFGHTCCDCGSSHNVKLTVINAEEIEVQLFKNRGLTKEARQSAHNAVLVSPEVYEPILVLLKAMTNWPKETPKKYRKKLQRLAKDIINAQVAFETRVKSGDFL